MRMAWRGSCMAGIGVVEIVEIGRWGDEEEKRETCLSAAERQSTIRQSGGDDDGIGCKSQH